MIKRKMIITTGLGMKDLKLEGIDKILRDRANYWSELKKNKNRVYTYEYLVLISETFKELSMFNFSSKYDDDFNLEITMNEESIKVYYEGVQKWNREYVFDNYETFDELEVFLMAGLEEIFTAENKETLDLNY